MKKNYPSTTMTALMLSLASLTLPPISDLHAAEIFTKVTAGPGSDAGYSLGAAWGDYDNDGFIDLFVAQGGGHRFSLAVSLPQQPRRHVQPRDQWPGRGSL